MKNKILVIGDVHACYYTFKQLIETIDLNEYQLIQVGDIIDRGNYPIEMLELAIQLETEYGAFFLLGNHELECIKHIENGVNENWLRQGGRETMEALQASTKGLTYYYNWMKLRPHFFEHTNIFVSHAGISDQEETMNIYSSKGLLWYRGPLKPIGKLQIHGHTPIRIGDAQYTHYSNSWNIDTAACYGNKLSALSYDCLLKNIKLYSRATLETDIR